MLTPSKYDVEDPADGFPSQSKYDVEDPADGLPTERVQYSKYVWLKVAKRMGDQQRVSTVSMT